MGCCSWKALVIILAVAVGLFAYVSFQKSTVRLKLSIVIKSHPQSVFKLFENPEDLPRYHPYITAVEVKEKVEKASVDSENPVTEYRLAIREEIIPILSDVVFPINLTATYDGKYILSSALQSERFTVTMNLTSYTLGMALKSNIVWTIAPATTDGETLVSEVFRLYPPRLFKSLAEDTARAAHANMLNNIKDSVENKSEVID